MDVGGWLRSLGLAQYEDAFRDNAIDDSVLPNLTVDDLKDLGVGIVGHRRKLFDAIVALRAYAKDPPPHASVEPSADDAAERRQVTVMFSDLVGSTALSTRLDPEDLREIISDYHRCVTDTVRRFGGFVAQYMGDGVLVYFGYPRAHEHDAELAVRAGLELIAAVASLKTRVALQTRIGIATGVVVVGDLAGSGETHERGIVGETPNRRRACRASPSPTWWSSPKARAGLSAIFPICAISAPRSSKASPGRPGHGRRLGSVRWKAASRPCMRMA